jgi:hypothetical protein
VVDYANQQDYYRARYPNEGTTPVDVIDRNDLYPKVCEVCSSSEHTTTEHESVITYAYVCTIMHTVPGYAPTYSSRRDTITAEPGETRIKLINRAVDSVVRDFVPQGLSYVVMFMSLEPNEL